MSQYTASTTHKTYTKPSIKQTIQPYSEPEPLDPDSDSDFNPGAYCPPEEKKTGGRAAGKTSRPRGRKRKEVSHHIDERAPKYKKSDKVTPAIAQKQNDFAKYFEDLDLQSASEDEDLPDAVILEDEEEEEDASEGEEEETRMPNKMSAPSISSTQSKSGTQNMVSTTSRSGREEDSVTESETESETEPEPEDGTATTESPPCVYAATSSKRKSPPESVHAPPFKKTRFADPDPDDSATEPEPDSDAEDSITEPESDDELPQPSLDPRPGFERKPDQPILPPLYLDKRTKVKVPSSINTFLRKYQRDGVKFFWKRFKDGKGGLLGDDMGLGKTIQIISFLSAIMHKQSNTLDLSRRYKHVFRLQDTSKSWKEKRVLKEKANDKWPTCLIICPSSVTGNWEREFEVWGYFEVGLYLGPDRANILNDFKLGRLDVVITSFEVARKDISLIDDLAWSCIIVDEVHRLKNPKSGTTIAFNRFECSVRFGLSGTVIQNTYSEMWSILDWTNPGCVGSKRQWEGYVARPLTRGQSKTASAEQQLNAALVSKILRDKILPNHFLRRTKDIIKDQLPQKIDEVVFCPLTPKQIQVYKCIINSKPVQNMIRKDENCDCGSTKKRMHCHYPYEKGDLFKYMSTLIKISNHLALILPSPTDSPEQTLRNRELSEIAFSNENIPKYGPSMLVPRFCGKWMVLETLLQEWRKDLTNKVLIFTKSVKLLEMLEFHLSSQGLGFVKLEGSTKQSDRMPIIDKFHQDPDIFIFLISTLAGGTGLNLTGANKVVIFDPNWNPAHDLQAMDRAYRFGQTRDVSVYRLLGAGSLEELIYARQVYKQQQMAVGYNASLQTRYFEGVQGEAGKQGELFGIKNIFKLHEDTLATKMAIERATMVDLDWAFGHLPGKPKTQNSNPSVQWVLEAEAKAGKEYGDLKGLGDLLFDDDTPDQEETSEIQKILNGIGVNYTHRNENLIKDSAIEEQRVKAIIEEKKKARRMAKEKAKAKSESKSPEPAWPPKRKHHKAPMSPKTKLLSRQKAMVELGMISSPADLPVFAQEFARKSTDEQSAVLAQLDLHARKHGK